MDDYETIIVGGGPAGSSCAWRLKQQGREVLVLDRQPFPRLKLCAGWVSESVLRQLNFSPEDYPYAMVKIQPRVYFAPFRFPLLEGWMFPWRTDYSIRRVEFDHWLLQRSQAEVKTHRVNRIQRRGDRFIIDDKFACTYLVGAGGTGCPVRRQIFADQTFTGEQISTIEKECFYPQRDDKSHLFFGFNGLKGYAWYVPQGNGYLNLGLGGLSRTFGKSNPSIRQQFEWFLDDLVRRKLLDAKTRQEITVGSHGYYLFATAGDVKRDNCYLVGDSAGLASRDLGEGIDAAVASGLLAAEDILGQRQYHKSAISPFSLNPAMRSVYMTVMKVMLKEEVAGS
jgi:flavin-dependent dehydrogenase